MIIQDVFRGEPRVSISFQDGRILNSLQKVRVLLGECQHDVAILTVSSVPHRNLSEYDGLPILIEYGSSSLATRFVGYVREVRPKMQQGVTTISLTDLNSRSPLSSVEIVCYGVSSEMRRENSRTWTDTTVPGVVAELARQYNLSADIEAHDYVWPVIAQGGESDFKFLRDLADMIGYRFTITSTHLRFYDPLTVARRPYILQTAAPAQPTNSVARNVVLREFNATIGKSTAAGFSGPIRLEGVDTATGESYAITTEGEEAILGAGLRSSSKEVRHAHSDAGSLAQAVVELQAERRKNVWSLTAEATLSGTALLSPGNGLAIDGVGADYGGLWYVLSIEHDIRNLLWQTYVTLGRDAVGSKVVQRPNIPVKFPPLPRLVLRDWMSTRVS